MDLSWTGSVQRVTSVEKKGHHFELFTVFCGKELCFTH